MSKEIDSVECQDIQSRAPTLPHLGEEYNWIHSDS